MLEIELDKTALTPLWAEARRRAVTATASGLRDVLGADVTSPSAPGSPPAVRSGALLDSVTEGEKEVSLAAHATYLELGTSRLAARPFVRQACERARLSFKET